MGSRARMAAAACLLASGLLTGGVGAASAFADPGQSTGDGTSSRKSDPAGRSTDTSSGTRRHDTATPGNGSGPVREKRADGADRPDRPDRDLPDREDREDRESPVGEEGQTDEPANELDPEVPADDALDVVARDGQQAADRKLWPPCCENPEQEGDCPPWWPRPDPDTDEPPTSESGSGGRPEVDLPAGLPFTPPRAVTPEFSPPVGDPIDPDVVDVVPVGGLAASGTPGSPVSMPVLVPAPSGAGPRSGPGTGGAGSPLSNGPRQGTAEPLPARQPPPATAGSNVAVGASSYRVGYGEYLRAAGLSQIAVLAVPGLAGILVLTGAGGLLGYRQAKAGHAVRTSGIARYMN
ncbi:hypothetical protein [Mycolicibacterium hippocampi]|uniref:Uncharacterized protein n=1 Tax=Mycolicibacterium hippocampi TaxID=659824 RepID=A0A7I9ZGF9_9MYCO|nr:hypothetical protein [Mycolicibacterium hippocampi]GFH00100.1 hypothetical protein MHIP_05830 [Mycolicibacterium hippocampi]